MKIPKSEFEIHTHAPHASGCPLYGKWELCHLSVVTQAKNEVVATSERAKNTVIFSRAGKKASTNLPAAVNPFTSQVCEKQ